MRTNEKHHSPHPTRAKMLRAVWLTLFALLLPRAAIASTVNNASISCVFSPHLSCSDTQSGELLWQKPRYSDPDDFAINHSRLYISHSTSSTSFALRTGEPVWRVSSGSDAHYFFPVISGSSVYLARSDGILEKREAASGALIWSKSLASGWVYPPHIQQNLIVTGGENRKIWVMDSLSGQIRDIITLKQELVAPLFQVGDTFIASTFDGQLNAYKLDPENNQAEPLWQTKLGAPAFAYLSNSEHLVAVGMGGKLSSINPKTGHIQWQRTVHQNALFWNVLYQKSLLSLTESGALSLLDLNNGQLQQQMQFKKRYVQAPIVRGKQIALYDINGAVKHLTPETLLTHPSPSASTPTQ